MIDFNLVRTNLYNWVIANIPTGMPAIYLYSNAPRNSPLAPVDYVTLNIASVVQIGWDYEQSPLTTGGISNSTGDREFTFQIQAYGGDVMTVMQNLRTSLQKQTVLDTLRLNGIVFANWFPINDLTTLVDSRYEQRASMDVLFRIADIYTDVVGVISTVRLQEVFFDAVGAIVYDKTFLIPPTP